MLINYGRFYSNQPIAVTSVYRSNKYIFKEYIANILYINKNIVLVGDLNVKHTNYGYKKTNYKSILQVHNILTMSVPNSPTNFSVYSNT